MGGDRGARHTAQIIERMITIVLFEVGGEEGAHSTAQIVDIQQNTNKYEQIQTNATIKHNKVLPNCSTFMQTPINTSKYQQLLTNTTKYMSSKDPPQFPTATLAQRRCCANAVQGMSSIRLSQS